LQIPRWMLRRVAAMNEVKENESCASIMKIDPVITKENHL